VEDVRVGDYVLLHVGYALTRLDPDEAERTLALMREAAVPGLPTMKEAAA
jgi:hydrogenase expression/formation protein HypC